MDGKSEEKETGGLEAVDVGAEDPNLGVVLNSIVGVDSGIKTDSSVDSKMASLELFGSAGMEGVVVVE